MSKARRAFWQILVVAVIGLSAGQSGAQTSDYWDDPNGYDFVPFDRNDADVCPQKPGRDGLDLPCCKGMPQWSVTEPYCNLWVKDIPLGYTPGRGPAVALQLAYKMRDDGVGRSANEFSFGLGWNCAWLSYVQTNVSTNFVLFPGGGMAVFTNSDVDFNFNTRLENLGASGFRMIFADGRTNIYGFAATIDSNFRYYLTEIDDRFGQKLSLVYATNSAVARLLCIVDGDGRTNSLGYNTNAALSTNLVVSVTDGYGRTANLGYNGGGQLANISDVQGLASSFVYGTSNWMTQLVTPYGTNTFEALEGQIPGTNLLGAYRSMRVTDAGGGTHLWAYRSVVDDVFPGSYEHYANSFYWGPRQYDKLSNKTNLLSLTQADYYPARRKYWEPPSLVGDPGLLRLLEEWDFSPDGVNPGQLTEYGYLPDDAPSDFLDGVWPYWWAYPNLYDSASNHYFFSDFYSHTNGTPLDSYFTSDTLLDRYRKYYTLYDYLVPQPQPWMVARVLPDGSTQAVYTVRNPWGAVVSESSTYSIVGNETRTRNRTFVYTDDGLDLLESIGFSDPNISIWSSGGSDLTWFTASTNCIGYQNHLPMHLTNALNEVTTMTYTDFGKVLSIAYPGGILSTTNAYFASGPSAGRLQSSTDYTNGFAYRTRSLTYSDDNVFTSTDARGYVTTYYWDNLGRPTGLSDGQGAVTNIYDKLDLVYTQDRMKYTNGFVFDPMRRLTDRFDALGRQTHYQRCTCGALDSVTEAVGTPNERITRFTYDNAGRLLRTDLPDSLWVTNNLDLLGRVLSTTDSAGKFSSFAYNNQGLVYAASNSLGLVSYAEFDPLDRPAVTMDANGVIVTNVFDVLGRLLGTGTPTNGANTAYGYSPNIAGPTSITDPLLNTTYIGYDPFGRKIVETNANTEVTSFTYDLEGALQTLTDGNQHTRTWNYYPNGWLSNKVDGLSHEVLRYSYNANGWVTNRWTPGKGNTRYGFDSVGNQTSIVYPERTVNFAFDELNRLTNMIDAAWTNSFTWSPSDQRLSETGPWANSTVTSAYTQGLRTGLTIGTNWSQSYAYEAGWRMTNITSPAGVFRYNYGFQPASGLVTKIRLPNAAYVTNAYDGLARLTNTALVNFWGHTLDGYAYTLDAAGLRRTILRDVGLTNSLVTAGYDNIGQLTSWNAQEGDGTSARMQEQLGWAYDAAHNLHTRTNGALVQTFVTDNADRLTSVSRSGTFTASGATPAPVTNVTVNGQAAQRYGDLTFAAANLTLADGANSLTNISQNVYGVNATNILAVNYPASVNIGADTNGNLTSDGLRTFQYDSENRLTNVFVPGQWSMALQYDGLNRMRLRRECDAAGNVLSETQYLYDGNLVVQERDSNSVPLVTYTRGLDMSGGLERAGGIGGLLARTDYLQTNSALKNVFYHADGNGNITALMDGQENMVGRYLYGPYGRLVGQWGTMASVNTVQFSSMLQYHGVVFYLRRPYVPELGRWATLDPIGEDGGMNLYAFVQNNPVGLTDPLGLDINATGAWTPSAIGPAGPMQYLHGDTIGEKVGATAYNVLPGMINTLNNILYQVVGKPMEPVNRAVDRGMAYAGDGADWLMPGSGQGARNLLILGALLYDPTKGANRFLRAGSRLSMLGEKCVAAESEARFIVSEGGTVVHASQAEMRTSLEGAGMVGTPTRSTGVAYDLPNGVSARAMEPAGPNEWRTSFNNASGTRVTPEGVVPQPPRGLTRAERNRWLNQRTHIDQIP
jgi:RHS repeat-associated protein